MSWHLLGAVALITGVGLALRLHALGASSLWRDEGYSAAVVGQPWKQFWISLSYQEMVIYYIALRAWTYVGFSEAALRSLSVVCGVATLPAVFLLGRRLFDDRVGLYSMSLLAVNVVHIHYSQEARCYAMVALVGVICWLAFVEAAADPRWAKALAWGTSCGLTAAIHFVALLILPAQWACLLLRRVRGKTVGRFAAATALALAIVLPFLALFVFSYAGQENWRPPTRWSDPARILHFLVGALHGTTGLMLSGLSVIFALLALDSLSIGWREARIRDSYAICVSGVVVPVVLAVAASAAHSMLVPRYFLFCVPPLAVFLGAGAARLRLSSPAGLMLALLFAGLTARELHWYFSSPKDDWRSVTSYVLFRSRPSDAVIIWPAMAEYSFRYYEDRLFPDVAPLTVVASNQDIVDGKKIVADRFRGLSGDAIQQVPRVAAPGQRVWLITALDTDAGRPVFVPEVTHLEAAISGRLRIRDEAKFAGLAVKLYGGDDRASHSVTAKSLQQ